MRSLLLGALLIAAGAAAEDQPFSAPIAVEGPGSHYRFAVPAAAYRGAARADLGDLRVLNAAGEPVPYAFVPRETQRPEPVVQVMKLFPLYGEERQTLESTTVRVVQGPRGTIVSVNTGGPAPAQAARRQVLGYLVDASEVKAVKQALQLEWSAPEGFTGHARVEASDDLKTWNQIAAGAPVLYLEHGGARLERKRVELVGSQAKYLRVSFDGVPRAFVLKEIRAELRPEKPELKREWLTVNGAAGKEGEWQFDAGGTFPVDRIRLLLPQPNTVVQVQILSRDQASAPWRLAVSAVAYRLESKGGQILSPDIVLPARSDRQWLVRADQKGGGFGSGAVRLEIGWLPHEVLFAARGVPPFTLAYGNKTLKPGGLPVSAVLPQQDGKDAAPTVAARVGDTLDSSRPPPSLLSDPAAFVRGISEDPRMKRWILWGALLAGVLFLAWMALRLMRDMGKN